MKNVHVKHLIVGVAAAAIAALVEALTDPGTKWAHAAWAPFVLTAANYLRTVLAAPPAAALALAAFVGLASCAHFPPGVNAPACGLDLIDDVASVLVCNLADHTPLPACVIDGLKTISVDHNCDVSGIVASIAGSAERNAAATSDGLEATKAQRAKAWLAAQPPNPADLPPLHDQKAPK